VRILNITPYYFPEVKFGGPPRKMLPLRPWLRGVPVLVTDSCGIAPMIDKRAGLSAPLTLD
jgi:hypothetical protein